MALIDNLSSYWKFDESSGTIIDAHGSNDGTYNGALYSQTGVINTGIGFDGTDDTISVLDDTTLDFGTGAFSINIWVKTSMTGAGNGFIAKDLTGAGGWAIVLGGPGTVGIVWDDTSKMDSTTVVNNGNYHMITWTRNASGSHKVYVDAGTPEDTITDTSNIDRATDLIFGKWFATAHLNGTEDEAAIWKGKELTESEIAELYNSGSGLAYPFSAPPIQQTKTGTARIVVDQSQAKTGTARIQIDDTEEVYDCEARIQLTESETKTGTARITIPDNQITKTGAAYIILQSEILKTGNASIDVPVEQVTKTGTARIEVEKSQAKTGTARIQIDDLEITKTGTARIELQDNQISKTGNASITFEATIQITKTGTAFISIPDDFKPIFNSIQNKIPKINSSQNMSPIIKSVEFSNLKSVKQSDKTGSAFIVFP